ncbi:MAG: cyanophycinase [Anaerolineae bacterium]|nr:cyanophycinase [Anaerolineae bacterium]
MVNKKPKGTLIIIGGHEDKEGDSQILKEVAQRSAKDRNLVILTVATNVPEAVAQDYTKVFKRLGATRIKAVDIRTRDDAQDPARVEVCSKADVIFFTGGDQLRITSQIGDSPIFQCLHDNYMRGATIVGTSAGAAAMSETMVINGSGDKSHELFGLNMAPGLGFIRDAVIDSHFAERGRIGRLLGAITQNPKNLGIGIDEDTAMIFEPDGTFTVMGSGAIYVVDGTEVKYSNLSEKIKDDILTVFNIKLHVLGKGYRFDLINRQPIMSREEESEKS